MIKSETGEVTLNGFRPLLCAELEQLLLCFLESGFDINDLTKITSRALINYYNRKKEDSENETD